MLNEDGSEYVAIVIGTVYLIPQIMGGYQTKTLTQLSTLSLVMLMFSSAGWAYYLYSRAGLTYYAYATAFVTSNALCLICMKYTYYVQHLKKQLEEVQQNPL